MTTHPFYSTFRHSTLVVERIGALELPTELRPEADRVVKAHEHLSRAATELTVAKGNETSLRAALHAATAALDAQLDELANELVAARLGTRSAPFAAFGLRTSRVRGGAQRKLDVVHELLDRLGAQEAEPLQQAITDTRAAEQSLRDALSSVTSGKATVTRLVASRDEAARASRSTIERLRHAAALKWEGQRAKQRELVGPVPRLRVVTKRRPRASSPDVTPARPVDAETGQRPAPVVAPV